MPPILEDPESGEVYSAFTRKPESNLSENSATPEEQERKSICEKRLQDVKASSDYRCRRSFYRTLTISPLVATTFFVYFLYEAAYAACEAAGDHFDIKTQKFEIFAIGLCAFLSSIKLESEIDSVNPLESAEEMLNRFFLQRDLDRASGFCQKAHDTAVDFVNHCFVNELPELRGMNPCARILTHGFTFFNHLFASSTYLIRATANAVPIANLTQYMILRWGLGGPLMACGILFLFMLIKKPVDEHSLNFISRLMDNESMVMQALNFPSKALEVTIQVLSNAINLGVRAGYSVHLFYKDFLNGVNPVTNRRAVIYSFAATCYVAVLSQSQNVISQFFNRQYSELSRERLAKTQISSLGVGVDVFMSLVRSVSTGVFLYRRGTGDTFTLLFSGTIGLMALAQGFSVRYQNRKERIALEYFLKEKIASAFNIPQDELKTPEALFDAIQKRCKTKNLKMTATFINVLARIHGLLAFLGFLVKLNQDIVIPQFNISFNFWDLVLIQWLWGKTTLENELSFFQEIIENNLSYSEAKNLIIEVNERPSSACSPFCGWAFLKVKSNLKARVYSKADFTPAELEKTFMAITKAEDNDERAPLLPMARPDVLRLWSA